MKLHLVKIIEKLAAGKKEMAIAYAEHLVKNCERNYNLFGGAENYYDIMTARNVLHTLKGEQKEGGVAVLDGVSRGGCKNPLEKLAHELGMFADYYKATDGLNGYVLTKAKLIIARMSMVRDHESSTEPMFFDCKQAVRDIRKIAEGKGMPVEYQPNSGGSLERDAGEATGKGEVSNAR